jgi:hypothetical protein
VDSAELEALAAEFRVSVDVLKTLAGISAPIQRAPLHARGACRSVVEERPRDAGGRKRVCGLGFPADEAKKLFDAADAEPCRPVPVLTPVQEAFHRAVSESGQFTLDTALEMYAGVKRVKK